MSAHPTQLTIEEILIRGADPSENRHLGNPQSVAAHARVIHTKEETYKRIMEVLNTRGPSTSKEIAAALNIQSLNCISGRFSEMKQLCWIEETGVKRRGAAELRAIRLAKDFELAICPKCKSETVSANMVFCYVCEDPPDMCQPCLELHVKTHSEAELDAALTA